MLRQLRRLSTSPLNLVRHTDVKPLGDGAFVGSSIDLGWGRIYGGQTMAQTLSACQQLAGPGRALHYFSCQFLRGGDVNQDVNVEAQLLTSGRSFAAVHARALQSGKAILAMTASLQSPDSWDGFEHQPAHGLRPEWRSPNELPPLAESMRPHVGKFQSETLRQLYSEDGPYRWGIEMRPATFVSPWDRSPREPSRAVWIRYVGAEPLPPPEVDPFVHQRLLAYASDWGLLEAAIFPHNASLWTDVRAASLSHTMYFHQEHFRVDQWLCHAMHSPAASGGRGFCTSEIWTEDGVLVASCAQEGLMRPHKKKAEDNAEDKSEPAELFGRSAGAAQQQQ